MNTPYYSDDLVTLYHGDCLEILPALSAVDLIVTSPPYNLGNTAGFGHYRAGQNRGGHGKWKGVASLGIDYASHDDSMPYDVYRDWQRAVLTACWATLSVAGAIYYNHKPRVQATTLLLPLDLNPGLPLRQIITWARAGGINYATTHYVPTSEWILVFAQPSFRLRDKAASGVGDVWRITQDTSNPHPASFPIGVPTRAIETTSSRLVLDPFAGSGTTLVAAKKLGRKSIGIEINESYCEMTAQRLDQGVLDFAVSS